MLNKTKLLTAMPFFKAELEKTAGWGSLLFGAAKKGPKVGLWKNVGSRFGKAGGEVAFGLESAAVAGGVPLAASAFIPSGQENITRSYGM